MNASCCELHGVFMWMEKINYSKISKSVTTACVQFRNKIITENVKFNVFTFSVGCQYKVVLIINLPFLVLNEADLFCYGVVKFVHPLHVAI